MAGQITTKQQTVTGPKTVTPKRKTTPATTKAKTKAVAKPETKSDFTPAAAKAHTAKIAKAGTTFGELMLKAYQGQIWFAMGKGYTTWKQYLDGEFGEAPLQLPTDKRRIEQLALAKGGMSVRAIADATGASKSQVARDIKDDMAPKDQVSQNGTPDVIDIDPKDITELGDSEPESREVLGKDGKSYTVTPQEPKGPTVVNIVSAARTLAKDIDAVRIRLDSLFSREEYGENKVDVQGTLETVVGDLLDTLVEEFGDLVAERAPKSEPAV